MKQKIIIAAITAIFCANAYAKEGCYLNPNISTSTSLQISGCNRLKVILRTYDTPQGNRYKFLSCNGQCDSNFETIPNPKQEDMCGIPLASEKAIACGHVMTDWVATTEKYGYKEYEICDELDSCYPAYQYKCNQGYYGTPKYTAQSNFDYDGCTRCPAIEGTTIYGVVSTNIDEGGYDNYSIIKCYIPKDTEINDETGVYTFTENCAYSIEA